MQVSKRLPVAVRSSELTYASNSTTAPNAGSGAYGIPRDLMEKLSTLLSIQFVVRTATPSVRSTR